MQVKPIQLYPMLIIHIGVTCFASPCFAAFGPVAEIKLHKKGGYGFVKYELHDSAVKAIAKGHVKEALHGRVLKCAWGKSAASSNQASAPAPAFNLSNNMQVWTWVRCVNGCERVLWLVR